MMTIFPGNGRTGLKPRFRAPTRLRAFNQIGAGSLGRDPGAGLAAGLQPTAATCRTREPTRPPRWRRPPTPATTGWWGPATSTATGCLTCSHGRGRRGTCGWSRAPGPAPGSERGASSRPGSRSTTWAVRTGRLARTSRVACSGPARPAQRSGSGRAVHTTDPPCTKVPTNRSVPAPTTGFRSVSTRWSPPSYDAARASSAAWSAPSSAASWAPPGSPRNASGCPGQSSAVVQHPVGPRLGRCDRERQQCAAQPLVRRALGPVGPVHHHVCVAGGDHLEPGQPGTTQEHRAEPVARQVDRHPVTGVQSEVVGQHARGLRHPVGVRRHGQLGPLVRDVVVERHEWPARVGAQPGHQHLLERRQHLLTLG